ncbi:MAG: hypothetical protein HDQ97_14780 [Lachnospiraceae bacterium]|nr:hypothetical protein [Lachnospiraceae bacterium]
MDMVKKYPTDAKRISPMEGLQKSIWIFPFFRRYPVVTAKRQIARSHQLRVPFIT